MYLVPTQLKEITFFFKLVIKKLQKGIDLAVADTKERVTCIISDAFLAPSFLVAQQLNVPWIPVWVSLSCSISAHFYTDFIRENIAENNAKD